MIEFNLSEDEIQQLSKEIANFDIIVSALTEHKDIDFCIDDIKPENIDN